MYVLNNKLNILKTIKRSHIAIQSKNKKKLTLKTNAQIFLKLTQLEQIMT